VVSIIRIDRKIREIRGHKVLLDSDLAPLYKVEVRALNQAVRRNAARFPPDFMFQLRAEEVEALRSQSVILDAGRGRHRKYLPHAFTEQGVAMLSSVLRSPQAMGVNVEIMRAFVRLRRAMIDHRHLSRRLDLLEATTEGQFRAVFNAIRELMERARTRQSRRIGF
jgi:hypothetical protein